MLGDNKSVSQGVTDAVVTLGWLWLFSLLFALPIALYVTIYNAYRMGTAPDVGVFAGAINPGFVVLGAAAALGGFVLLLSNATFGEETVDATIDQGQELAEEAQEQTGDVDDDE